VSRRSRRHLKLYLLITVSCCGAAVLLHLLFRVPQQVQAYTDRTIDAAVQQAVKEEVSQAAKSTRP
jgi:hypothetical protein